MIDFVRHMHGKPRSTSGTPNSKFLTDDGSTADANDGADGGEQRPSHFSPRYYSDPHSLPMNLL